MIVGFAAFLIREFKARLNTVCTISGSFQKPQFCLGQPAHRSIRRGDLWTGDTATAFLSDSAGLSRFGVAGLAVSPRGLGAIAIMPVVAVLTAKVDNRWLIATGFLGFAVHLVLDGPSDARYLAMVALMADHYKRKWRRDLFSCPFPRRLWGRFPTNRLEMPADSTICFAISAAASASPSSTRSSRATRKRTAPTSRATSPPPASPRHKFGSPHGPTLYHVGPNIARLHRLATVANGLDIQATVYSYVDDLALPRRRLPRVSADRLHGQKRESEKGSDRRCSLKCRATTFQNAILIVCED